MTINACKYVLNITISAQKGHFKTIHLLAWQFTEHRCHNIISGNTTWLKYWWGIEENVFNYRVGADEDAGRCSWRSSNGDVKQTSLETCFLFGKKCFTNYICKNFSSQVADWKLLWMLANSKLTKMTKQESLLNKLVLALVHPIQKKNIYIKILHCTVFNTVHNALQTVKNCIT